MADGEVRALEPEERERVAAAEWAICVATFYGDLAERLTNGAFEGFGLTVVEQVPIEISPNAENRRYLETKREKLGHQLHHQDVRFEEDSSG